MRFPYEVTDWDEIKVGDKVEVTDTHANGAVLITTVLNFDEATTMHAKGVLNGGLATFYRHALTDGRISIRILSRPKPEWKVGDTIRADQVKELPAYSILVTSHEHPAGLPKTYFVRKPGSLNRWFNITGDLHIDFDYVSETQGWLTYVIKQIGPWT